MCHCLNSGTGKSTIFKYLVNLLTNVREKLVSEDLPIKQWLVSDQTLEKLGELMASNDCKALGLYDELTNGCPKLICITG